VEELARYPSEKRHRKSLLFSAIEQRRLLTLLIQMLTTMEKLVCVPVYVVHSLTDNIGKTVESVSCKLQSSRPGDDGEGRQQHIVPPTKTTKKHQYRTNLLHGELKFRHLG